MNDETPHAGNDTNAPNTTDHHPRHRHEASRQTTAGPATGTSIETANIQGREGSVCTHGYREVKNLIASRPFRFGYTALPSGTAVFKGVLGAETAAMSAACSDAGRGLIVSGLRLAYWFRGSPREASPRPTAHQRVAETGPATETGNMSTDAVAVASSSARGRARLLNRDALKARILTRASIDGRTRARKQFDAIAEGIAQDLGGEAH